ncbi:MAG: two pore domain potassium channel family protein [Rhodobacteraceae bacterium]|nr:two pore domain potassium channel family protein [Paracoccaceae bacterium]
MASALAGVIGLALILTTVAVHYEALRLLGRAMAGSRMRPRVKVLLVILGCIAAHLVEILIYAAAYGLVLRSPSLGNIEGLFTGTATELIYFAMTSYTTLGIGDVYPTGPLQLIVGMASLNGFLLITWSASFTYLVMQRYWHPELED